MPLGSRGDCGDARFCGLEIGYPDDIADSLSVALSCGYDFVVTPLARPGRTEHASWPPAPLPLSTAPALPGSRVAWTRSDRDLAGAQWSGQVVGTLSRWADPDSSDPSLAADSLAAWAREAAWASHLGLQAVVVDLGALWRVREARGEAPWRGPGGQPRTLRALADVLEAAPGAALWVLAPLQDAVWEGKGSDAPRSSARKGEGSNAFSASARDASWAFFDALRVFSDHSSRLGAALSVGAGWERAQLVAGGDGAGERPGAGEAAAGGPGGVGGRAPCVPAPAAAAPSAAALARWRGEPLKALFVETAAFTKNKKGFAVLPKPLAAVVTAAISDGVQIVVREGRLARPPGTPKKGGGGGAKRAVEVQGTASEASDVVDPSLLLPGVPSSSASARWEYASYLFRRAPAPSTPAGAPCDGEDPDPQYRDLLQAPLQPLADDLESGTYETFERDRIKYQLYEEAIELVLRDRLELGLHKHAGAAERAPAPAPRAAELPALPSDPPSASDAAPSLEPPFPSAPSADPPSSFAPPAELPAVRIAVCGAGRGPLVAAALRAADRVGVPVRVEVVEKNTNALVTLAHRLRDPAESPRWLGRVRLTPGDMRSWVPAEGPGSVDVLVSELLGSFGDNELSPECLDGPARWLEPAHGVSIPSRSASYAAPVAASGPWADARAAGAEDGKCALDTPYVVQLHRARELAEPQMVFSFYHGRQGRITDRKEDRKGAAGTTGEGGGASDENDRDAEQRKGEPQPISRAPASDAAAPPLPAAFPAYPPPPLPLPTGAPAPVGLVSPDSNDRYVTLRFVPSTPAPPAWSPAWATAAQAAPGGVRGDAETPGLAGTPACVVHGFVGYFDSTLYGPIQLSTLPATHTPGMHSWFPIFFPLRDPVRAEAGESVSVAFWRRGDARKVWYEWGLVEPRVTLLQNLRGKNYHVGLM